jgi:hypothetical protein
MGKPLLILCMLLVSACATNKPAATSEDSDVVPGSRIKITTSAGAPDELETRSLLRQILTTTNVETYFFVREVRVESNGSPSSSPVININTANHDRPDDLLSQLLRLEIDAFMEGPEKDRVDVAVKSLAKAFPEASDAHKLMRAALELQADERYMGEGRARSLIQGFDFDQDLYALALKNESRIIGILKRHEVSL